MCSFVGHAFCTVSGKTSSNGMRSNMLVRIISTTRPIASPTGGARSRTSSFQFSFMNVFMLSPEQKMIQHLEIVAINIHTLAVIVPSVIMLCLDCVADWFVTLTADGSRL